MLVALFAWILLLGSARVVRTLAATHHTNFSPHRDPGLRFQGRHFQEKFALTLRVSDRPISCAGEFGRTIVNRNKCRETDQ